MIQIIFKVFFYVSIFVFLSSSYFKHSLLLSNVLAQENLESVNPQAGAFAPPSVADPVLSPGRSVAPTASPSSAPSSGEFLPNPMDFQNASETTPTTGAVKSSESVSVEIPANALQPPVQESVNSRPLPNEQNQPAFKGNWSELYIEKNNLKNSPDQNLNQGPFTGGEKFSLKDDSNENNFEVELKTYENHRPKIGVMFEIAPRNLSDRNGVVLQVEFLPLYSSFGVIGVGPVGSIYPTGNKFTNLSSSWSLGIHGKYQLKFFSNQPIVPSFGLQRERVNYKTNLNTSGSLWTQSLILGAMIYTNFFDSEIARNFYENYGISRTYFVSEMKSEVGSNSDVQLKNTSYFFGLRFEF